ncbi:hypothetical protein HPP92_022751 [Vanilla planifolia]|uniref:Uncharacterized protein n=1 Tax=Vanilla planifolia TaxID=51239 RepID=A0A835UFQ2_VANPL|nr:hypothetical protein HPP92_022751 [Vanilla planifolia]
MCSPEGRETESKGSISGSTLPYNTTGTLFCGICTRSCKYFSACRCSTASKLKPPPFTQVLCRRSADKGIQR